MFMSKEKFLGNRGARDTFFHQITLKWAPHSNNVKHANVIKQVRGGGGGGGNSMSKGRPKSIGMWYISNIPVSNQYYSF